MSRSDLKYRRSLSPVLAHYYRMFTFSNEKTCVGEGALGSVCDVKAHLTDPAATPQGELKRALKLLPLVQKEPKINSSVSSNLALEIEFSIHEKLTRNVSSYESGILKLIHPKDGIMIKGDAVLSSILDNFQLSECTNAFYPYFIVNYLESMCRALKTLRRHEYIHADIKLNNVVLRLHADGDIYFALIDLGSARNYQHISAEHPPLNGTLGFCSPESVCGGILEQEKEKLDIYPIGCILYLLLNPNHYIDTDGLSVIRPLSKAYADAKQEQVMVDQQARLNKIFSARTILEKFELNMRGMCELLPENRLSFAHFDCITKHLRKSLPVLSGDENKELFRWYRQLLLSKQLPHATGEAKKEPANLYPVIVSASTTASTSSWGSPIFPDLTGVKPPLLFSRLPMPGGRVFASTTTSTLTSPIISGLTGGTSALFSSRPPIPGAIVASTTTSSVASPIIPAPKRRVG